MAGTNGVGRFGVRSYVAPVSLSTIITNGLIFNLDASNPLSYSGTGTTWMDLSGNGNNGTLVNGASYSSINGGVMMLDGINDYVDLGDKDVFDGFGSYSLSAWVYINSFRTYNAIFHKWGGAGYSYFLGVWSSSIYAGENYSSATGGKSGGYGGVSNTSSIQTGRWYNIVYTSTVSNISVYIDGVLDKSQANTWRGGNIINGASSLKLGTHIDGSEYTNCRIANSMIYNRELSASEVLQNFNSTKERFGYPNYTARTSAFAAATGITDTTILNALNTFDTGLISNGLDTKMKALYPFVGGTANTHKFNFMDARDVDAAFRLQFNGGGTHSSTGYKPNGYNAYANTFLIPETQLSLNSNSYGFYSRTEAQGEYYDMGAYSYPRATVMLARFNGSFYAVNNDAGYDPSTNSTSLGFLISSRTGANIKKGYRNNIEIQNSTRSSVGLPTLNIYLGGISGYGGFTPREFAFAFMGNGLNAAEIANFTNLVNTLQTSLSRAV